MTDSTTLQILSQMSVQAELVRESEQARAELGRLAELEAVAAQLPERRAEFDRLQAEVTRLDIEARQAHEAEVKAASEHARAILDVAAGETAAWRGDLQAMLTASKKARGPGEVREFFSRLDNHIAELPAIHAPLLAIQVELRALAGEHFKRLWTDAGGDDARFNLQFKPGELSAHPKKVRGAIKSMVRQGKIYFPGSS